MSFQKKNIPSIFISLVSLAAAAYILVNGSVDTLSNDSAQYISSAVNLESSGKFETSTLYYESQIESGMPAAQTVWPPGFPILIALLKEILGNDQTHSILIINSIAHGLSVILLFFILRTICRKSWPAALLATIYALHFFPLKAAISGTSEPTYIAFILLVTYGLARGLGKNRKATWLYLSTFGIAAAALIRYQAIVCAAALGCSLLTVQLMSLYKKKELTLSRIAASMGKTAVLLVPFLLVFGGLLLRNYAITGSPTGGPTTTSGFSPAEILDQVTSSASSLLLHSTNPLLVILVAAIVIGIIILMSSSIIKIKHVGWHAGPEGEMRLGLTVFGFSLFFGAILFIIIFALKTTAYDFDPRYVLPTLPPLIIAITALLIEANNTKKLSSTHTRITTFVIASLLGLTAINISNMQSVMHYRSTGRAIRLAIDSAAQSEISIRNLLITNSSNDSPILSNQSQLLYLAIRKPTVGIPQRRLNSKYWRSEDIYAVVKRLNIQYVLIFKKIPNSDFGWRDDYVLSAFKTSPTWAKSIIATQDVELFEVQR